MGTALDNENAKYVRKSKYNSSQKYHSGKEAALPQTTIHIPKVSPTTPPPLSPFSIGVYQYIFVCMVFRNNTNTDEINYLITYMSLHRSLDLNSAIIAAHPSLTCAFSMAASNGRNIVRSFNVLTRLSGT